MIGRLSGILLALLIGIVGALIVHIGVIFAMPRLAEDNVWARLVRLMPSLQPTVVSTGGVAMQGAAAPSSSPFGFLDPAFMVSTCRFPLADGPIRIASEGEAGFWSASINARSGDTLYSINQRLALAGRLDLVVGTREQIDAALIGGLLGEQDTIPVVVTAAEVYVTIRVLMGGESQRPFAERYVRSLTCAPLAPAAAAFPAGIG